MQKADIKIDWRERRELPDCGGSSGTRKGLGNRLGWDDITETRRIKYERQRRRTAAAVGNREIVRARGGGRMDRNRVVGERRNGRMDKREGDEKRNGRPREGERWISGREREERRG